MFLLYNKVDILCEIIYSVNILIPILSSKFLKRNVT